MSITDIKSKCKCSNLENGDIIELDEAGCCVVCGRPTPTVFPLTDIKQQREAEFDKEFPNKIEHVKGAVHGNAKDAIKAFLRDSMSLIEKEVRKEEREKIKEELVNAIENKKSTRLSRDHQPYQVCLLEMSALVNELLNEKPE